MAAEGVEGRATIQIEAPPGIETTLERIKQAAEGSA
jgi:hypothetical protein